MKTLKVLTTTAQLSGMDKIHGITNDEYKQHIMCKNCGHAFVIAIKKGYLVSQSISQAPCPNCGCEWLEKKVN